MIIRRALLAAFVGALLLLGGEARAQIVSPACIASDGCSFSACEGSFTGTNIWYACDCQTGTHGGSADADCVVGNDLNAGTSPSAPLRTFEALRSKVATAQPGDRFMLCKGGVFTEATGGNSWVNHNFTALNPGVAMAYTPPWASGDEGKPIVNVPSGQNGIDTNEGADTVEHGYHFSGFALIGSGSGTVTGGSDGFFVYNQVSDGELCDMVVKDFSLAFDNSGGTLATDLNKNWTIRNSDLEDNGGQGILGANDGAIYANNRIKNNGFANHTFNHNVYLVEGDTVSFIGNELSQGAMYDDGTGRKCSGAELVLHGINANTWLKGNLVDDSGVAKTQECYGLQLVPGYSTAEININLIVELNVIHGVAGNGIGVAATHTAFIRDNLVLMTEGGDFGIVASDDGVCLVTNPSGCGDADARNQNVQIINNTLDMGGGFGVAAMGSVSGGVVANNVVRSRQASGTAYCFAYDQTPGSYAFIGNNDCFRSTAGSLVWEYFTGDGLAAWQTASSWDTASISADPLFTNVAGFVYTLQAASPLRNAGSNTYAPATDYLGISRPQETTADIGAYEYQVGVLGGRASFFGLGAF